MPTKHIHFLNIKIQLRFQNIKEKLTIKKYSSVSIALVTLNYLLKNKCVTNYYKQLKELFFEINKLQYETVLI